MSAILRLKADHDRFSSLGQALETQVRASPDRRDGGDVRRLAEEFRSLLSAHAAFEDRVVYPAIRARMGKSAVINEAFMNHLDNEHRKIDEYLDRMLAQISEDAPGWEQTFALFSIGLRTHMRKEEESLFPEAERLLADVPPLGE